MNPRLFATLLCALAYTLQSVYANEKREIQRKILASKLGIAPTATKREILSAFRKKSLIYHTDKAGFGMKGKFQELNNAAEALGKMIDQDAILDFFQNFIAHGRLKSLMGLDLPMSSAELNDLTEYFNVDDNGQIYMKSAKVDPDYPLFVRKKSDVEFHANRYVRASTSLHQEERIQAVLDAGTKFESYLNSFIAAYVIACSQDEIASFEAPYLGNFQVIADSTFFGYHVLQKVADVVQLVVNYVKAGQEEKIMQWAAGENIAVMKTVGYYMLFIDSMVPRQARVAAFKKLAVRFASIYQEVAAFAALQLMHSDPEKMTTGLQEFVKLARRVTAPPTNYDTAAVVSLINRLDFHEGYNKEYGSMKLTVERGVQGVIAQGRLASDLRLEFPLTADEKRSYFRSGQTVYNTKELRILFMSRLAARGPQWKEAVNERANKFKMFLVDLAHNSEDIESLKGCLSVIAAQPLFGGKMLHSMASVITRTIRYRQVWWLGPLRHLNPLKWLRKWKNYMLVDPVSTQKVHDTVFDSKLDLSKRLKVFGNFLFDFYAAGYDEVVSTAVNLFLKEPGLGRSEVANRFRVAKELAKMFRAVSMEDDAANTEILTAMLQEFESSNIGFPKFYFAESNVREDPAQVGDIANSEVIAPGESRTAPEDSMKCNAKSSASLVHGNSADEAGVDAAPLPGTDAPPSPKWTD